MEFPLTILGNRMVSQASLVELYQNEARGSVLRDPLLNPNIAPIILFFRPQGTGSEALQTARSLPLPASASDSCRQHLISVNQQRS